MFSNTLDGYIEAQEYLEELGKLVEVKAMNLTSVQMIAEANSLKRKQGASNLFSKMFPGFIMLIKRYSGNFFNFKKN